MRRLLFLAIAVAALTAPASTLASPYLRSGIQDDAWLQYGPGTLESRVAELDSLGVDVVRVTLNWRQIEPRQGVDSWARSDELLGALHKAGIAPFARFRRGDRTARVDRRRVARRLDRRHEESARTARRVRAQPVSAATGRDADGRRVRPLHDDHDGDAAAPPERGAARVRHAHAHLADGVRLPDESAGPAARRLPRDRGAVHGGRRAARLRSAARRHPRALPRARRAGPRALAERFVHRTRRGEAGGRGVQGPARAEVPDRPADDAVGPGASRRPLDVPAPAVPLGRVAHGRRVHDERARLLHAYGARGRGRPLPRLLAGRAHLQPDRHRHLAAPSRSGTVT